jgi:SAM-dependent methyltransferase
MHGQLLAIRSFELERARPLFAASSKVLELGGGNGWQASNLAAWGLDVQSIDVAEQTESYHPVSLYDGIRIPYPDHTFDLIFSSNVLEHLERRPALFAEMVRVLKQRGAMIHIVPTSSWRFWTSVAHYPYMVKRLVQSILKIGSVDHERDQTSTEADTSGSQRGSTSLKRLVWAGPHGIDQSALKEVVRYSRWGWRRCFKTAGLEIADEFSTGLWYTGYGVAPGIGLRSRATLSRIAGSSCRVFVLRPASRANR